MLLNRMVRRESNIDDVFHALADATRRQMLRNLEIKARTIGEFAAPHDMSLVAASKHVKVLERAGLLRREIQWRTHICHLEPAPLAAAYREIGHYERLWMGAPGKVDRLLRDEDGAEQMKE